jgi:hypothetical protein
LPDTLGAGSFTARLIIAGFLVFSNVILFFFKKLTDCLGSRLCKNAKNSRSGAPFDKIIQKNPTFNAEAIYFLSLL